VFIEADDFMEVPPPKYFRLRPGGEVRLKYACIVTCVEVVKDAAGNVVELRCTADLETRAGGANAAKKVKGTIHWVSASHAVEAEVRLYDRLFLAEHPGAERDFLQDINPDSMRVITAQMEPSLGTAAAQADAKPMTSVQFERHGYFCVDRDSSAARPLFNRAVTLRDTWQKST
jgi:glutaminyl-tRNA synthetase